jgi:hypothetical protein
MLQNLSGKIWCSLSPEAEGVGGGKFCRFKEQKRKFSRAKISLKIIFLW